MEEDSDDSDDYDHQQAGRKSSGLGEGLPKKPYRDSGDHKERYDQQRPVQKDWQGRVDNYGYIERKTHAKHGESNQSSAANRGKIFYVKVDGETEPNPKAHHNKREARQRTPEYRVKG
jgi:hypothetical protein